MTYREAQTWENEELKWGGELRAQQEDNTAVGEGSKGEGQVPQKEKRIKLEARQSFLELFRWLEKGGTQDHP